MPAPEAAQEVVEVTRDATGTPEAAAQVEETPAEGSEVREPETFDGLAESLLKTPAAEEEAKPEVEAKVEEDAEKPAFDPAEFGLNESYAHCGSVQEAFALMETRRVEAARKIQEQGEELARLKKPAEPEKKPEQAQASEWSAEDRQRFLDDFAENPDKALGTVLSPMFKAMNDMAAELVALRADVTEAKAISAKQQEAARKEGVDKEWTAFVAEHPDAQTPKMRQALFAVGSDVNGSAEPDKWLWFNTPEAYALAQVKATDAAEYKTLVRFIRGGFTLEEARAHIVNAKRAGEANGKVLADKAKKVRQAAGPGGGGAAGSTDPAMGATSIEQLAERLRKG